MGGISFWQLIIITLILAALIYCFHLVRKGPKHDLVRPFRFLNGSFLVSIAATILVVMTGSEPAELPSGGYMLSFLVLILSGWTFWISLGVLASRLGRSPIIWVGVPFITSPIGPIVAYFMMRSRVQSAMSDQ